MTRKTDWIFRTAALVAFALLAAACSDDISSRQADSDAEWIDPSDDVRADAGVDASQDIGADADIPPDADGRLTAVGWYKPGFESALFVPDTSLLTGDWQSGCRLPLWQNADAAGAEKWWASGIPQSQTLAIYPPSANASGSGIGLIEASGRVSELGEHGHLGAYDRNFEVTSSRLDTCGAVEALGHCLVPQGWCVNRDVEDFELVDTHLRRELPGAQPSEPTLFYDLTIGSDKSGEWTEIRLSIDMPGDDQNAEGGQLPLYTVDELRDVSLTQHTEAFHVSDTRYENLTGWAALDTTALRETIMVSISGTDDDGNQVHVWGQFPVDETLSYP